MSLVVAQGHGAGSSWAPRGDTCRARVALGDVLLKAAPHADLLHRDGFISVLRQQILVVCLVIVDALLVLGELLMDLKIIHPDKHHIAPKVKRKEEAMGAAISLSSVVQSLLGALERCFQPPPLTGRWEGVPSPKPVLSLPRSFTTSPFPF